MIVNHGVAMLQGMAGSSSGYWSRASENGDLIQHSSGSSTVRRTRETAEATFQTLRDMPEAPATFVSVDVCEVIGQV